MVRVSVPIRLVVSKVRAIVKISMGRLVRGESVVNRIIRSGFR